MENTEIMNNEVIEVTEEAVKSINWSNATKLGLMLGLGTVAGYTLTTYVLMPLSRKIKDKINKKKQAKRVKEMYEEVLLDDDDSETI